MLDITELRQLTDHVNNLIAQWWESTRVYPLNGTSYSPKQTIGIIINAITNNDNRLNNEIEQLKKQIAITNNNVAKLSVANNEIAQLKNQLSRTNAQLSAQTNEIQELKRQLSKTNEYVRQLSAQNNEIAQLKNQLSITNNNVVKLSVVNNEIQELKKQFSRTNDYIAQLSAQTNEIQELTKQLNMTSNNVAQLFVQNQEQSKQLNITNNNVAQLSVSNNEIAQLKNQLSQTNDSVAQLKSQLIKQQQSSKIPDHLTTERVNSQQNTATSSSDQTIDAFNEWAKNIGASLPSQFNYAEGDLKLREKQKIQFPSTNENDATWIMNKSGYTKYLFPNPNAIDELSGKIDTLYTVTGNRRARGQNIVNIKTACIVKDGWWIEYKGELSLI